MIALKQSNVYRKGALTGAATTLACVALVMNDVGEGYEPLHILFLGLCCFGVTGLFTVLATVQSPGRDKSAAAAYFSPLKLLMYTALCLVFGVGGMLSGWLIIPGGCLVALGLCLGGGLCLSLIFDREHV